MTEKTNILIERYQKIPLQTFKFPYDGLIRRITPKNNFLALFSPNRTNKRKLETIVKGVKSPFNKENFNFNKIAKSEIFGYFDPDQLIYSEIPNKHKFVINAIPCTPFHGLFVPFSGDNLPQFLEYPSLHAVISLSAFVCKDSPIKLGFNSLGGNASVNHLHFHLFSILKNGSEFNETAIEKINLEKSRNILVENSRGIFSCYCVRDKAQYPINLFAFVLKVIDETTLGVFCELIMKTVRLCQENSVAHNLVIIPPNKSHQLKDVVKVFVWPRRIVTEYKTMEINFACLEMSGIFCVKKEGEFRDIKEDEIIQKMQRESLSESDFQSLQGRIETLLKVAISDRI